jgi:hypothetical protein
MVPFLRARWPARDLGGLDGEQAPGPLTLHLTAHVGIARGRLGLSAVIPWSEVSSIEAHGDPASVTGQAGVYGRTHLVVNCRDGRQAAWEISGYDPSAIKAAIAGILARRGIPLAEHWDIVGIHRDGHGKVVANLSDFVGTFWLWPDRQQVSYEIRSGPGRDGLERLLSDPTLENHGISTPGGCSLAVKTIQPWDPARLPGLITTLFAYGLRLAEPRATWPGGSCHPVPSAETSS